MSALPLPALVVLVGPSGAGKTTWARARFAASEIVSSDALRAVVGSGESDLDASDDAFAALDLIVAARARRGLTTVIDTLGLDPVRRRTAVSVARSAGLPSVAVRFDTDPATCRQRNRERARPVPAPVLTAQLQRAAQLDLEPDGFDLIITASSGLTVEPAYAEGSARARHDQDAAPVGLRFALQISSFPWGADPGKWLRSVAAAAEEAGFTAIAVMDHLLQIPQVGRAWDPIPEAYTTLAFLAGVTERVQLGALVTPVTYRSAPLLAKIIATLDVVSAGRAFCALGAGWYEREHHAYDLSFPPAGERLDRLAATIGVLRAFWGAGTKPYGQLPETTCYPRPLHDIPIIVGGSGTRTLEIAARVASGCNLPSSALDVVTDKIDILRAQCERSGRPFDDLEISVLDVPVIGLDRDDANGRVETLRGRQRAATYAAAHHAGPVDEHIGRYRLLADRGVRSVFVAFPGFAGLADLERFRPVLAAFSTADPG